MNNKAHVIMHIVPLAEIRPNGSVLGNRGYFEMAPLSMASIGFRKKSTRGATRGPGQLLAGRAGAISPPGSGFSVFAPATNSTLYGTCRLLTVSVPDFGKRSRRRHSGAWKSENWESKEVLDLERIFETKNKDLTGIFQRHYQSFRKLIFT